MISFLTTVAAGPSAVELFTKGFLLGITAYKASKGNNK